MDFSVLSKYRGQLMGIAIVLVALFHSSIVHANPTIDLVCFVGDMGVDIFFFLSGMGMFYTYRKDRKTLAFYKKRMVRIIPAWFLVNLYIQLDQVGFDVTRLNPVSFVKYMTGFSFWLEGNLYFWYIPAALAFYAMTPAFMWLYKKNKKQAYAIFSIIWMGLVGVSILVQNASYFIFLFRWPVFFLGILFGDFSYQKKKIKKAYVIPVIIVLILGLVMENTIRMYNGRMGIRYEYKYFIYVMISIPICLVLTLAMEKMKYSFGILRLLGNITLEIYLLHEYILRKVTMWIGTVPFDSLGIVFNVFIFLATAEVAWVLHVILSKAIGCFKTCHEG